jgi:hypothetical protein
MLVFNLSMETSKIKKFVYLENVYYAIFVLFFSPDEVVYDRFWPTFVTMDAFA